MAIQKIVGCVVEPGKSREDAVECKGFEISQEEEVFDMLRKLYLVAEKECTIPVRFTRVEGEHRKNEMRTLIIEFIEDPSVVTGLPIANKLCLVTPKVSGLGLLTLILGQENGEYKLVVSRFPAAEGIGIEELYDANLRIKAFRHIFVKNKWKYKAALYQGSSFDSDFIGGHIADKQLSGKLARYWTEGFLQSDYVTTSKQGSKSLAISLREAARKAKQIEVKEEIICLCLFIHTLDGQLVSIYEILDQYELSETAKRLIISSLPYPDIIDDEFRFDYEEFRRCAAYSCVEFDSGSVVIAPFFRFDDCYDITLIDEKTRTYRYSTEGRIVDYKIMYRN